MRQLLILQVFFGLQLFGLLQIAFLLLTLSKKGYNGYTAKL
jgi:hypothetical protein